MQVSGLIVTHHLSEEAVGWFSRFRDVVDEIVAFVDEERAVPGVHERLRRIGARVFSSHAPTFYESDFARMWATCEGDWVLRVDYDEQLSPEWWDPRWREILHDTPFTHFYSPRRWVVPSGTFLDCAPWWPDWQMRLCRKDPDAMIFPRQLHDTIKVAGEGAYLRTLAIHHYDLPLTSREARERKVRAYEELRRGYGLGYFYLFEDHSPPESPLPSVSDFDPQREVLRVDALSPEDVMQIALRAHQPPSQLDAGQLLWLDVKVTNDSRAALCCAAPFPVNLAYHWLQAGTRETAVFDGERTAILPELAPGRTGTWKMFIITPDVPGDYLLQVTMVQEQVRWLEAENPNLVQEFAVTVRPARNG